MEEKVSLVAKKNADEVNYVYFGGVNINVNRLRKHQYLLYRLIDAFIGKDKKDDDGNDLMLGKIGYKVDQAFLLREIKDVIEGKIKVYNAVSHKYNENSVYLFSIYYYKYSVLLDVRYSEEDGLFITDIIDEPTDGRVRVHFVDFINLMQNDGVFLLIDTDGGSYMAKVSKDEALEIDADEVVKDVFYVATMSFGNLLYLEERDDIDAKPVERSELVIEAFA
jgi:hypothetical protein